MLTVSAALLCSARAALHESSPRLMAVLDPLPVLLARDSFAQISVPDFPFDPSRGAHAVTLGNEVYIERADFRMQDSEVEWRIE